MRLKHLRQRRADLTAEAQSVFEAAEKASRSLTAEERKRDDDIATELQAINDEIGRLERMQERLGQVGSVPSLPDAQRRARIEVGAPNLAQDPRRGFSTMGEFALAVHGASLPQPRVDARFVDGGLLAATDAPATYYREDGALEGVLVPPQYREEIWRSVYTPDSLLDRLTFEPTNAGYVEFTTDEATPWGAQGVSAKWRDEGDLLTETKDKGLRARTLKVHPVDAFVVATNELLEDAPRLNARLSMMAPQAIQWKVIEAVVRGNGVARPLGWLNAANASLITVAKETSQAAGSLLTKNIFKMLSRLHMLSGRHFWLANQGLLPEMGELQIGTSPVWTPANQGLKEAPVGRLLGAPLYFSEQASAVGEAGDLQLIDPAGYYGLQRGAMRYDVSIHLLFDRAMTAFRWTARIGGAPFLTKPVDVPRSDTRSTFIALGARA